MVFILDDATIQARCRWLLAIKELSALLTSHHHQWRRKEITNKANEVNKLQSLRLDLLDLTGLRHCKRTRAVVVIAIDSAPSCGEHRYSLRVLFRCVGTDSVEGLYEGTIIRAAKSTQYKTVNSFIKHSFKDSLTAPSIVLPPVRFQQKPVYPLEVKEGK